MTCLFVNKGGTATHLSVQPLGPYTVTVEPTSALKFGDIGRISLTDIPTWPGMGQFLLSYKDSYGQRVSRHYAFFVREAQFKEI